MACLPIANSVTAEKGMAGRNPPLMPLRAKFGPMREALAFTVAFCFSRSPKTFFRHCMVIILASRHCDLPSISEC